MNLMLKITPITLFLTTLLLCPSASAHGVFWQLQDNNLVLMEGHQPGHGHDDSPAVPLESAWVKTLLIAKQTPDKTPTWDPLPLGTTITIPASTALSLTILDWGWWTKNTEGTHHQHPDQVAAPLQAWYSKETIKHITTWLPGAEKPAGEAFEISPQSNPLEKHEGDKITLQVTLDGVPIAEAVVTYQGQVRGTTKPDGTVRLKLRHGGYQEIKASLRRPAASPEWAEDVQTATLSFTLDGKK